MSHFIIVAHDNRYWQTARGFVGLNATEATKYRDREEALKVIAFCCPGGARSRVEEVRT
jgi:hypothetical protein